MDETQESGRRILVICDFAPGLLENVLAPYELMSGTEVILVRRRRGPIRVPKYVRVVDMPLRVLGTSEKRTISTTLALLLNTVSYLFVGSLLSTFAALRFRCQIIHARFLFPQGVVGLIVSMLTGVKLVVTAEGSDVNIYLRKRLSQAIVMAIARRAQFISVSLPIRNQLRSLGLPSHYLPNSVDGSKFKFVPLPSKQRIIVFVGSLTGLKRPQFLIDALNKIREFLAEAQIKTLIVGDGPLRPALQRQIQEKNLEGLVELEGYRSSDYVIDLLSRALAYVSCSTMEGMSLAMLEAMASGPVVIASDIPSTRALITSGETGFTFPSDDLDQLARTLKFVFEHASEIAQIPANARELVESTYDIRKNAVKLMRIYTSREILCL